MSNEQQSISLQTCPFCGSEMTLAKNPAYCHHPKNAECPLWEIKLFEVTKWNVRAKRYGLK